MSLSERDERFGGSDHVRAYGPDIKERIEDAGFTVTRINSDCIPTAIASALGFSPILSLSPNGPSNSDCTRVADPILLAIIAPGDKRKDRATPHIQGPAAIEQIPKPCDTSRSWLMVRALKFTWSEGGDIHA